MEVKFTNYENYLKNHSPVGRLSSTNLIASGAPDPAGLLSPIIFGETIEDKRFKVGFIELNSYIIRPGVYRGFINRMGRKYIPLLAGVKFYLIKKNGRLVEVDEGTPNAGTGIGWLYENWDKIHLEIEEHHDEEEVEETPIEKLEHEIDDRDLDISYLKKIKKLVMGASKEDIFCKRLIVLPLAYRDIDMKAGERIGVDKLNSSYISILKYNNLLANDSILFSRAQLIFKLQNEINQLYSIIMLDKLMGKYGVLRTRTMGKTIDYSSRLVISAPPFDQDSFESKVTLDVTGLPLSSVLSNCRLMLLPMLSKFMKELFDKGYLKTKNDTPLTPDEFDEFYNTDELSDMLDIYDKSWGERVKKVRNHGNKIKIVTEDNEYIELRLIDILYMVSYQTVELRDLFAVITRYPITDTLNVIITKIHILTTHNTREITIDGIKYPNFPDLRGVEERFYQDATEEEYLKGDPYSNLFVETARVSNLHLPGLNGDYDGDKLAIRILFTEDANSECLSKINNPLMLVDLSGKLKKDLGYAIQVVYSMTKDPDKNSKEYKEELTKILLDTETDKYGFKFIFEELRYGKPYSSNSIVTLDRDIGGLSKGSKTTLGRLLFYKVLLEELGENIINEPMTKSVNNKFIANLTDKLLREGEEGVIKLKKFLNKYENFTFKFTPCVAPCVSRGMQVLDKRIVKRREELFNQYKVELANNDATICAKIESELIGMVKEIYKDDPEMELYTSGAKLSLENDYKAGQLMLGNIPDGKGGYLVVTSNTSDGIKKDEVVTMANQGTVASFGRAQNTQEGGTLVKQLSAATDSVEIDRFGTDCKTTKTFEMLFEPKLESELKLRFIVEGNSLVQLTDSNIKNYIGKVIKLRSPVMCKNDKLCSVCCGHKLYDYLPDKDKPFFVGIHNTKLFSELLQKQLKLTHDMSRKTFKIKNLNDYLI